MNQHAAGRVLAIVFASTAAVPALAAVTISGNGLAQAGNNGSQVGLTVGVDEYIGANMLADQRRKFGGFLRGLRTSHDLTLRELAKTSKVPFPNISAIDCGRLGAGRIIARKLAQGLALRGSLKEQFLIQATFTNSRDRLSQEHLAYPAVLANVLAHMLRQQRVQPRDIVDTFWENPEAIENPRRPRWGRCWGSGGSSARSLNA